MRTARVGGRGRGFPGPAGQWARFASQVPPAEATEDDPGRVRDRKTHFGGVDGLAVAAADGRARAAPRRDLAVHSAPGRPAPGDRLAGLGVEGRPVYRGLCAAVLPGTAWSPPRAIGLGRESRARCECPAAVPTIRARGGTGRRVSTLWAWFPARRARRILRQVFSTCRGRCRAGNRGGKRTPRIRGHGPRRRRARRRSAGRCCHGRVG